MVDEYMSPSRRRIDDRSIGAVGRVSANQPSRNRTWSSSRPYRRKLSLTMSTPTRRTSTGRMLVAGVRWVAVRIRRRKPRNESAAQTVRSVTPCAFNTPAHEDDGAASPHPGLDQVAGHVVSKTVSMHSCRLSMRLRPIIDSARAGQSLPSSAGRRHTGPSDQFESSAVERGQREIPESPPHAAGSGVGSQDAVTVLEDRPGQHTLEKVEVEARVSVDGFLGHGGTIPAALVRRRCPARHPARSRRDPRGCDRRQAGEFGAQPGAPEPAPPLGRLARAEDGDPSLRPPRSGDPSQPRPPRSPSPAPE